MSALPRTFFNVLFPSRQHSLIKAILFASLLLFATFWFTTPAHALTAEEIANEFVGWILSAGLMLARLMIALTVFMLSFFIQLAAYNGYLDAPVVKLGWTMVRDVGNMFFVVILLVIAFATILGKENYEWKKTMVKLVLAAIFINFSLLIAGVVIDAAHVFTVTFLNAVAPAAGGNLINMFNLEHMQRLVQSNDPAAAASGSNLRLELLGGVAMAMFFAGLALVTIAIYCVIMLMRMVVIWILLILSPLAFVFSVLPATKGQAQEWLQEFTKHVIVAPVMVFFLWLAFASFGAPGSAADALNSGSDDFKAGGTRQFVSSDAAANDSGQAASINAATTWHRMASFLVAVGFLFAGIDRVKKLGVKGSGLLSTGFFKNAVNIAAGIKLAQWGARKAPVVGGEAWSRRWRTAKAKVGYGKANFDYGRDKLAVRADETFRNTRKNVKSAKGVFGKGAALLKGATIGVAGRVLAASIESGGRKEKQVEDWEKAEKIAKERNDKMYATGKFAGGEAKLKARGQLELVSKFSDAKNSRKIDDKVSELLGSDKEMNKLFGNFSGKGRDDARSAIGVTQADAEESKRKRRRSEAEQTAAGYDSKGDTLRSESTRKKAAQETLKETEELIGSMNYGEKLAKGAQLVSSMKAARATGVPDEKKLAELTRQNLALLTAAMNKDGETGGDTFRAMLQASGFTAEVNDENIHAALAAALTGVDTSAIAGDNEQVMAVLNDNIYKAFGDDTEALNQAMSGLEGALKKTASDGGLVFAGLVSGQADQNGKVIYGFGQAGRVRRDAAGQPIINPNTGDPYFDSLSPDQVGDRTNWETHLAHGTRNYFAGRQKWGGLTDIKDFANFEWNGVDDFVVTGFSPKQLNALRNLFRGKNTNALSNLQSAFLDSMKKMNQAAKDQFIHAVEGELQGGVGQAAAVRLRDMLR